MVDVGCLTCLPIVKYQIIDSDHSIVSHLYLDYHLWKSKNILDWNFSTQQWGLQDCLILSRKSSRAPEWMYRVESLWFPVLILMVSALFSSLFAELLDTNGLHSVSNMVQYHLSQCNRWKFRLEKKRQCTFIGEITNRGNTKNEGQIHSSLPRDW